MVSFTLVKTYENNKINGNILTNLDSVHFNKDPTFNLQQSNALINTLNPQGPRDMQFLFRMLLEHMQLQQKIFWFNYQTA